MPLSSQVHLYWILMPWKFKTRRDRIVGAFLLVCLLFNTAAIFIPALQEWTVLAFCLLVVAAGYEMIQHLKDGRKFKKDMSILHRWGQLLDGTISEDDLTGEEREEIAIARAAVYTERGGTARG